MDEWTTHLGSAEDDCFVQLFYYKQSEENEKAQTDMKYVVTLSSKWSNLPAEIERVLKDGNYGVFGRSVGIISKTGDYPILKPLESFFSDPQSYKSASKITILVASSFDECKRI